MLNLLLTTLLLLPALGRAAEYALPARSAPLTVPAVAVPAFSGARMLSPSALPAAAIAAPLSAPGVAVSAAPAPAAATLSAAAAAPAAAASAADDAPPAAKPALAPASAQVELAAVTRAADASGRGAAPDDALSGAFDGRVRSAGAAFRPETVHHFHQADASLGAQARRHDVEEFERPFPVPPELADDVPSARGRHPEKWTSRISLHLHSQYSDGTLTPTQLVEEAHRQGVRVLSLTDHDTTAGLAEAAARAAQLGMVFIAGEEMTARGGVHVGALGIDPQNPALVDHNETVRQNRLLRAQSIIDHLNARFRDSPEKEEERGLVLTIDEVKAHSRHDAGGTIEIPAIARVLLDHGLIAHVDDAYTTYLTAKILSAPDVPPDPTVEEVLAIAHGAGGKAFLNHPYTIRGADDAEKDAKAQAMLPGFDGLEAYRDSNATSENGRRRFDGRAAKYLTWARDPRHPLLVGNGADYHGPDTHLDQLAVWMPKKYAGPLLEGLGVEGGAAALERFGPEAPQPPPAPAAPAAAAAPGAFALLSPVLAVFAFALALGLAWIGAGGGSA